MMMPKIRSKAMTRYAKLVFRAIRRARTTAEVWKSIVEYQYAKDYAAAAWEGILPVRRTGYRAVKGGEQGE